MKEFKHPNVMGLIGVCLDMGPVPYIVLPFMSGGDLLTHIQQKRSSLVVECSEDEEMVCSYFTLHYRKVSMIVVNYHIMQIETAEL